MVNLPGRAPTPSPTVLVSTVVPSASAPSVRPPHRPGRRVTSRSRATLAVAVAVAVVVLATVVAGCGTSGRTLRDPEPGATAPPRKTSTTPSTAAVAPGLTITSPAWTTGGMIPATFTCDGAGVSPQLTVNGAPGTVELVVVVTDTDAGGRVHWVLAGLPGDTVTNIPQGGVPLGAVVGLDSAGRPAWEELCPPAGATHTYDLTVYAMSTPSGITDRTPADEALTLVLARSTDAATLSGTYTRPA